MGLTQDAPAAPARTSAFPEAAPAFVAHDRVAPDLTRPDVSVCIVNWNCVDLLRKCLASIYARSQGVSFETIVVDNGSSDGAADMVANEFAHVTLIRNRANLGFSAGNNQAASVADGRYLFFLNNDTELPGGTLKEFVTFADRNPGVGMVGPKLRGADGNLQISYRTKPTLAAMLHRVSLLRWTGLFRRAYYRYRRDTFEPEGTRSVEVLMGAAVFLPRSVFEQSGKWDERYRFGGEDLDLSTQVGRRHEVVYFSNIEILHYGRVSSRANVGFSAPNVAIGYVHYFRKAGVGPAALFVYKLLVTVDTPLQIAAKVTQATQRLVRGKTYKAKKSWLAARGLWHFMNRELIRFWRA
ncbi:glycosyltransferase family 2 protein [Fimbriiglobus ruber]|uniref:Glycosyl transferase, family 2 n=1 Tax=Fimbriiglobus ruber TaxID=1908690 RepID=A0A225DVK1_9BACT|nr:glycosyltransferase family 2 protein [Fimbriiglobus ruber]OWK45402.1 Glycosyl transferase, family 2 [Fimbriiglobus ruber]